MRIAFRPAGALPRTFAVGATAPCPIWPAACPARPGCCLTFGLAGRAGEGQSAGMGQAGGAGARGEFIRLDRADSMSLLASVRVGRLIFTVNALPTVRLMNFAVPTG
jgi:hypothetical protein